MIVKIYTFLCQYVFIHSFNPNLRYLHINRWVERPLSNAMRVVNLVASRMSINVVFENYKNIFATRGGIQIEEMITIKWSQSNDP
jgi:hypothetical protein